MKNPHTPRLLATAALILAASGLAACGKGGAGKAEQESTADAPVPVEAFAVARQPIIANYTGTASLEAEREAQVVAKTSGVLLRLRVEEGDKVAAGQVLAELDPERPKLQLAQAAANLKRLQNDFRRAQEMFQSRLVSSEQFDKVRFDLETQQAAYDLAELELSYTHIVAPIDGVISERLVKEGNLIQLHQPLFRIDDFDPLLAVLNVPERELSTLRAGQAVQMQVDSMPGQKFEGAIQRISPVVDAATGTFRVTCEFRDASGQLKSGMFGRLGITFAKHDDTLAIPRSALMDEDGETAVYVVVSGASVAAAEKPESNGKPDPKAKSDKGKAGKDKTANATPAWVAKRRLVKVGYSDANYVEVNSGLEEGDRVITLGRSAVRDGTAIQVLEAVQ